MEPHDARLKKGRCLPVAFLSDSRVRVRTQQEDCEGPRARPCLACVASNAGWNRVSTSSAASVTSSPCRILRFGRQDSAKNTAPDGVASDGRRAINFFTCHRSASEEFYVGCVAFSWLCWACIFYLATYALCVHSVGGPQIFGALFQGPSCTGSKTGLACVAGEYGPNISPKKS